MNKIELFDLAMDFFSLLYLGGERRMFPLSNNSIDQALSTLHGTLTPDLDEMLTFSAVDNGTRCNQFLEILDAAVELDLVELLGEPSTFNLKLSHENARMNAVRSGLSTEEFTFRGRRLVTMIEEEERF